MRARFTSRGRTWGYIETVNGVVVPSNARVDGLCKALRVAEPFGINPEMPVLTYADGDRYIQAIRYYYRGAQGGLAVELIEGELPFPEGDPEPLAPPGPPAPWPPP
jgi:hypothetical protein